MSSSEVEIHLVAYDEASEIIANVGATMQGTLNDVEGSTQGVAAANEELKTSFSSSAMSMNSLAMAGMGLYMSYDRIEQAQVRVDRANLMVQRSTETLEKAQTAYNDVIAKYGPASTQAKDALDKLSIAQNAYNVAVERAQLSSQNLNNSMMFAALSVIPSLISIISIVSNATEIWAGVQVALNAVMDANPIFLVIAAIAALVAGIIYAYNTCETFRNGINALGSDLAAVGSAIAGAVSGFVGWVTGANNASVATAKVDEVVAKTSKTIQAFGQDMDNAGNMTIKYVAAQQQVLANLSPLEMSLSDLKEQFIMTSSSADTYDVKLKNLADSKKQLITATDQMLGELGKEETGLEVTYGLNYKNTDAYKSLQQQIDNVIGSKEALLGEYDKEIAKINQIPAVINEQLVNKAQADIQAFKDCSTGKMSSLADESTDKMSVMASDVTDLINHGLVGEAQNAMQAYTSCSTNKVATMAMNIGDTITKMTTEHNKQIKQMADYAAILTGSEKDAVLSEIDSMNSQYETKLTQLRDWQTALLGKMKTEAAQTLIPGAGGAVNTWAGLGRGTLAVPDGGGRAVNVTITAPLVNIEGSADKATVDLASKQVLQALQTTIVEPTSSGAAATQKRIRSGSVFVA
jgi:hypothetical protein